MPITMAKLKSRGQLPPVFWGRDFGNVYRTKHGSTTDRQSANEPEK